jgi:hypothetical protein
VTANRSAPAADGDPVNLAKKRAVDGSKAAS